MPRRSGAEGLGRELDLDIGGLAKPLVKRFECGRIRDLECEMVETDDTLSIEGQRGDWIFGLPKRERHTAVTEKGSWVVRHLADLFEAQDLDEEIARAREVGNREA